MDSYSRFRILLREARRQWALGREARGMQAHREGSSEFGEVRHHRTTMTFVINSYICTPMENVAIDYSLGVA